MTRNRTAAPDLTGTLVILRPTGAEYGRVTLADLASGTIRAVASDTILAVRNAHGWTPSFRLIRNRDGADVSGVYAREIGA